VESAAAAPVLRRIDGWPPDAGAWDVRDTESTDGDVRSTDGDTESADADAESTDADTGAAGGDAGSAGAVSESARSLARSLLAQGLLTLDHANGKAFAVQCTERPRADLLDVGLDDPPSLGVRDVARFAAATIAAWLAFRSRPLDRLVRRVSRRRAKRGVRAGPFDRARATRCAAVYERLRPLAFTARDACLFESLAFVEFAARYGLYPLWVFGVQTTPFAAHCWVQHGSLVLNDSAENAAAYTPILVV
jgi:hypothetical protein